MKKKTVKLTLAVVLLAFMAGCASMGATNTTTTNTIVASYESAGAILRTAYNAEKASLVAGKITAEQDAAFQNGPYKKAYDCYQAIGAAAVTIIATQDVAAKQNAQAAFDRLNAELPGLLTAITTFVLEVK